MRGAEDLPPPPQQQWSDRATTPGGRNVDNTMSCPAKDGSPTHQPLALYYLRQKRIRHSGNSATKKMCLTNRLYPLAAGFHGPSALGRWRYMLHSTHSLVELLQDVHL